MSQNAQARAHMVERVTAAIQAALLKGPATTEKLFSKYHRPVRDVRSENLVVTAIPAVAGMRFLAGSMFEFYAALGRPSFAAGEDFFPEMGDVILLVADQDEPDIIQGLALVRASAAMSENESTDTQATSASAQNYMRASYDLIWTMVQDNDSVAKLLMAAYVAEATRTGFIQLTNELEGAGNTTKEDVVISYEYRDCHDDELYEMMVDNLVLVINELGRNERVRKQFNKFGWMSAD
jgi:hypothetical protein